LGIIGSVVSAGFLTGPLLGGFLVEHLGWRSVFFINLPIGAFGILLSAKVLERQGRSGDVRLDLLGAFLFFSFITFLLLFLNRVGQSSAPFPWEWLFLSLLCLGFLIFVELRSPSPLVNLRLFKRRLFTSSLGASLLSFWMVSAHAFVVPFFLQGILKFSPSRVGMLVFPVSLTVMFMAPLGGRFSDRFGVKIPTTIGLIVCSLTIFSFIFLKEGVSDPQILLRQVFLGIGIGFFNPANNSAIIGSLSKEQIGLASSFMALSRNLGLVIGVAFAEMVIAFSAPTHSVGTGAPPIESIQNVWRFALVIGLAALFISWGRWRRSGRPSRGEKGIADC
jgi:MFS family permease